MHIAITDNFRSVLILLFCRVFSKYTLLLMEDGLADILRCILQLQHGQGRHELPVLHTPQTSVLFGKYTVHFLNLPISVLQRKRVRDLNYLLESRRAEL
jgi:hypothetical protein